MVDVVERGEREMEDEGAPPPPEPMPSPSQEPSEPHQPTNDQPAAWFTGVGELRESRTNSAETYGRPGSRGPVTTRRVRRLIVAQPIPPCRSLRVSAWNHRLGYHPL